MRLSHRQLYLCQPSDRSRCSCWSTTRNVNKSTIDFKRKKIQKKKKHRHTFPEGSLFHILAVPSADPLTIATLVWLCSWPRKFRRFNNCALDHGSTWEILKTSINEFYTIHSIFVSRKSDKHAFWRFVLRRIKLFSFAISNMPLRGMVYKPKGGILLPRNQQHMQLFHPSPRLRPE
jgi:hypothetical protein